MDASINVLGGVLQPCSTKPMTGFFRNGCCDTGPEDRGSHTVCVILTDEFLAMSRYPEYGFAGLKTGQRWCLCASRFLQAAQEFAAPTVVLESTHKRALEIVPLELLKRHAGTDAD